MAKGSLKNNFRFSHPICTTTSARTQLRLILFLCLFALLMLEGMYRLQLVDCYRGELLRNNSTADLRTNTKQKTLLIMGDSFAAQADTFAFDLRRALDGRWRSINSAVGGTGVVQAALMAPRRFRKFTPSLFLYEIYVGNDLFDLRYPGAWGRVSALRSLYWVTSRNFRSLAWLNYKLGQFRAGRSMPPSGAEASHPAYHPEEDVFSKGRFNARDRIYARAEPGMIADSVLLWGRRGRDFDHYLEEVDRLLDHCQPENCRIILLVIPHFSQISAQTAAHARSIGFEAPPCPEFSAGEYPFVHRLRLHYQTRRPGLLLINPLISFQQATRRGSQLYYQNDSHLNPIGQHLLADTVLEQMKEAGLGLTQK